MRGGSGPIGANEQDTEDMKVNEDKDFGHALLPIEMPPFSPMSPSSSSTA